jgi:proteasome accessory factor B
MFERDKEELRNIGIEIEVGSFDPLFEDEVGYRIRPEKYRIQISTLSNLQFSLISLATQLWKGAVLGSQANSALLKLKSLGIESDTEGLSLQPQPLDVSDESLAHIVDAISSKKVISFGYLNKDSISQERAIEPLGVGTKNGFWYVAGKDLDRKEIRLFRLDRFSTPVKEQGRAGAFAAPENFKMSDLLQSQEREHLCKIKVRTDKAQALRKYSTQISTESDWDVLEYSYADSNQAIRDILWHRDDVLVIEPQELIDELNRSLSRVETTHG